MSSPTRQLCGWGGGREKCQILISKRPDAKSHTGPPFQQECVTKLLFFMEKYLLPSRGWHVGCSEPPIRDRLVYNCCWVLSGPFRPGRRGRCPALPFLPAHNSWKTSQLGPPLLSSLAARPPHRPARTFPNRWLMHEWRSGSMPLVFTNS